MFFCATPVAACVSWKMQTQARGRIYTNFLKDSFRKNRLFLSTRMKDLMTCQVTSVPFSPHAPTPFPYPRLVSCSAHGRGFSFSSTEKPRTGGKLSSLSWATRWKNPLCFRENPMIKKLATFSGMWQNHFGKLYFPQKIHFPHLSQSFLPDP